MALLILFALLATPIAEIAAFIQVGGWIGVWPTLGLTIATAVVGTFLLRLQGVRTLHKVQDSLNRGVLPMDEVFDGFFLVIAGALLLTPGFITDVVGLMLFLAPIRALIKGIIRRNMARRGHVHIHGRAGQTRPGPHGPGADPFAETKTHTRTPDGAFVVIDGEYVDISGGSVDAVPGNLDGEPGNDQDGKQGGGQGRGKSRLPPH